ncbi:MAG: GAF domain-containing protein [Haliscomenobacter sp.]|nr:GAF domain-containing protein [Haliscomenobacter sp.]
MEKIRLKSLVGKEKPILELLDKFRQTLRADFSIEDDQGKILFGPPPEAGASRYPIHDGNGAIGYVSGGREMELVAATLSQLAQKEAGRRQVGTEVLNLYREINLIYNYSGKLAETINPQEIAEMALQEASHMIHFDGGVVAVLPEDGQDFVLFAQSGASFITPDRLPYGAFPPLSSGQSDIVYAETFLPDVPPRGQSLLYASLKVKHRVLGAIVLLSEPGQTYTAPDLKLLNTFALQSAAAIESALLFDKNIREARAREEALRRLHEATTKFVPFEFLRALGRETITEVQLGDYKEQEVTVLFSDIRDYTRLAESMTPEDNFRFVNAYNGRMGPIIQQCRGFVNQYLGDGIMAIFPFNPFDALEAAIAMHQNLHEYNKLRKKEGRVLVKVGMGLHTGPLIMGIIGDQRRLDAATIADTVNTASRIESLTKYYGTRILLSEDSLQLISHTAGPAAFRFRYLGKVQVKGKLDALGIYECYDGDPPEQIEAKAASASAFAEGIEAYFQKNFHLAEEAFIGVLAQNPEDYPARLFLDKARQFVLGNVPPFWTGIEKMEIK